MTSPISLSAMAAGESLGDQFESVAGGWLPHRDKGTKSVHSNWAVVFNSVAAFAVFLFSFFVKIGSGGPTNSHGHPLFLVESRAVLECAGEGLLGRPRRKDWSIFGRKEQSGHRAVRFGDDPEGFRVGNRIAAQQAEAVPE